MLKLRINNFIMFEHSCEAAVPVSKNRQSNSSIYLLVNGNTFMYNFYTNFYNFIKTVNTYKFYI